MEVVIGGSRGLGLAIAMELALDRDVIAVARSEPQPAFALGDMVGNVLKLAMYRCM